MGDSDQADKRSGAPLAATEAHQDTHNPIEEIAPDDLLYRRLTPEGVNPEGTANSAAYHPRTGDAGISVDVARLTTIEAVQAVRPEFGVGAITAGVVRSLGLTVRLAPDESNPSNTAHALIEGELSKAKRHQLAKATTVLRLPTASRKE